MKEIFWNSIPNKERSCLVMMGLENVKVDRHFVRRRTTFIKLKYLLNGDLVGEVVFRASAKDHSVEITKVSYFHERGKN